MSLKRRKPSTKSMGGWREREGGRERGRGGGRGGEGEGEGEREGERGRGGEG